MATVVRLAFWHPEEDKEPAVYMVFQIIERENSILTAHSFGQLTQVGKDGVVFSCDRHFAESLAGMSVNEDEAGEADQWEKVRLPIPAWEAVHDRYVEIIQRSEEAGEMEDEET